MAWQIFRFAHRVLNVTSSSAADRPSAVETIGQLQTDHYRKDRMKLRFEVDQAESFRRGIDCPNSIVALEIDPADVSPPERELFAARMQGIDLHELLGDETKSCPGPSRIRAKTPTLASLMEALRDDQKAFLERPEKIRKQRERAHAAMARANGATQG